MSYATGSVSGTDSVGGLVGLLPNSYSVVESSYATGAVTGSSGSNGIGGLVGLNQGGTVEGSYATGSVTGHENLGGLVGDNASTVNTSYATGAVTGDSTSLDVGGLIGDDFDGTVETCYSTGSVSGITYVGGLVGYTLDDTVENNYWLQDSGLNTGLFGNGSSASNAGATPESLAAMEQQSTFLPAGVGVPNWDFTTPVWTTVGGTNTPQLPAFRKRLCRRSPGTTPLAARLSPTAA